MEGIAVTQVWMGGVVAMMLVFGVIVAVGLYKQKKASAND